MERINEPELIKRFYEHYHIETLFSEDIIKKFELFKVNRLEYICYQEEEMNYLYFLVYGKAKVFKLLANGKTLLINFNEPLEVIGDVELIKSTPAACTVQAVANCYLLALSTDKLRTALKKDIKLLNFICVSLAKKLDHISKNSSINLLYPLENRLADYIAMLAVDVEGDAYPGKRCFNENLTQLAELLGISYRHLLRTLNGLCSKEILMRTPIGYIIMQEAQLAQLAKVLYE